MRDNWEKDEDKLTFIILLNDKVPFDVKNTVKNMVGDVNLFIHSYLQEENEKVAEIEVMVAEPSVRRKGLASSALKLIMEYAITKLNVTKFVAKIKDDNLASIRLFEESLNFKLTSKSEVFKEVTLEYKPPPIQN